MGGPMSVNDEANHPWIRSECDLLKGCIDRGLPTLGICLGGQLMAKALGARVEVNPVSEIGWHSIVINSDGQRDPILGAAGTTPLVYQWHHETFHIPSGSTPLAQSSACPRQAFRVGTHAYALQFHPEADSQMLHDWLAADGIEEELRGLQAQEGPCTIQDAETQKRHALCGEQTCVKFLAAIGQLFREHPYEPVNNSLLAQLESLAKNEERLLLTLKGAFGQSIHIIGHITTLLSIRDGEFVIFREQDKRLWPVRLDHVETITPIEP